MKKSTLPICITLITLTLLLPIAQTNAQTTTTLNLNLQDIQALPKTTVTAQLSCYGTPLKYGEWTGVKLSDLINQTENDPTIASVNLYAQDGYTVSLPLSIVMQPDVIIAYELDNAPLSEGLRLVVPNENGAIWIAMITTISTSTNTVLEPIFTSAQTKNPPVAEPLNDIQQRQPQVTPAPPTPKPSSPPATTIPTPSATSPPANNTKPETQTVPPQQTTMLSIEPIYGIVLGFIIALMLASAIIYRRNRNQPHLHRKNI